MLSCNRLTSDYVCTYINLTLLKIKEDIYIWEVRNAPSLSILKNSDILRYSVGRKKREKAQDGLLWVTTLYGPPVKCWSMRHNNSRLHLLLLHAVTSDIWQPYERVISKMFCPQQPCSALVNARLWLPWWSHAISYLIFLFSCCLQLFLSLLFPENLASHDTPQVW